MIFENSLSKYQQPSFPFLQFIFWSPNARNKMEKTCLISMLTPRPKANVKHLNYLGVTNREIVRSSREIISASPKKAALIQIHTDSPLKLRIRLLESLPTAEPKLSNEMHIIAHSQCGDWKLSLSPKGNLTSQTNGKSLIEVANAFVHQSRVFYINKYFGNHEILSDNGKFLTSLPASFGHPALPFWQLGDYISYNDVLIFSYFQEYFPY